MLSRAAIAVATAAAVFFFHSFRNLYGAAITFDARVAAAARSTALVKATIAAATTATAATAAAAVFVIIVLRIDGQRRA